MDMKKHIYLFLLLCSIGISYPAFTGQEQEIRADIGRLIEQQVQANKKCEEAWNTIMRQAPNGCAHSLSPATKKDFKKAYPGWIDAYATSPKKFRHLFE